MQLMLYLRHSSATMLDLKNYQDVDLLGLMRSGDVSAFTEIYRRYAVELYAVARNGTGDPDKAEDIVQEVFVSLWQKRVQSENIVLKGWLLVATRFQVLKAFRQTKSNRVFQERISYLQNNLEQGDPLHYRELQRIIPAALQSLPTDQQQIFRMHREDELSYREIAGRLGISVKTVEKKMSLVLRHLRLEMAESLALFAVVTGLSGL